MLDRLVRFALTQRVFVLLNLLGRQVRVRVPLDTVAAAV